MVQMNLYPRASTERMASTLIDYICAEKKVKLRGVLYRTIR